MVGRRTPESVESRNRPAQEAFGELKVEIAELVKRRPDLVDARPIEVTIWAEGIGRPRAHKKSRRGAKGSNVEYRITSAGSTKGQFATRAAKGKSYSPSKGIVRGPAGVTIHLSGHASGSDPVNDVTDTLADALRREPGLDLSELNVPRLVQSMLRLVPRAKESNVLAEQIGPFYDTPGLVTWLKVSRQALDKKIRAGKLLACMTSDKVRLYPTWQFTESGALLAGLPETLATLHQGTTDGWVIAAWMTTPVEELNGTAVKWLTEGRDARAVLQLAHHDAAVWAA